MASKTILKAVATVTIFSVITRTLSFVFKIYLSRTLGAEIMGLYQICLSIFFMFSALSASGLPTVLSRKTAEANALDTKEKGLSLFTATLFIGVIIAVVTFAALALLKPYLGNIIADSRAIPLFMIMLPALVSTCIYSIIRGWFWGNKKFTAFSVTETIEEVLRILFTILFVSGVVSGVNGAYGIALAFTVSDITVAIILSIMFFAKGGRLKKFKKPSEIAKPALPLTAMRVFGSLIGTIVAVLLPARLIAGGASVSDATASVGRIAGMANPLLFAPNAIISSLAIVLIPEMSQHSVKKDYASLNKNISSGLSFALIVSGIFMVVFAALGTPITKLLYADTAAGSYLEYAAYLLLFMPINQIATSSMNSIGLEKESFFTYMIGTAFMMLCIFFLPKYIGIYSVVVANFATLTVSAIGNIMILNKHTGLGYGVLKPFISVALIAVPCVLLGKWMYGAMSGLPSVVALLISAIATAGMYAAGSYATGLIDFDMFMTFAKKKRVAKAS